MPSIRAGLTFLTFLVTLNSLTLPVRAQSATDRYVVGPAGVTVGIDNNRKTTFSSSVAVIDRQAKTIRVCRANWTQQPDQGASPRLETTRCLQGPFSGPTEALEGLSRESMFPFPSKHETIASDKLFSSW
jgi:hypothetical protein